MIISQTPAATTTTTTVASAPKPALPSISEPEYRNLFASVNSTFTEILLYEIETLLSEDFAQAYTQFRSAQVNYETQIWRWPYNGEAAYPFSSDLRNSGKSLNMLLEKGLPLRSDAEKAKAGALANKPRPADIPATAAERLAEADAEFAAGKDFHTKARYRSSIASFKRATLLYESADARTRAEVLKSKVDATRYGKYSPHHLVEADQYLQEDASLCALSNNDAIQRGTGLLEKASRSYENILAWGAEREAMEARDRAFIARQSADWLHSELNAAGEYSAAATQFSDAEGKLESSHFDEATALYDNAAVAFEIARLSAGDLECSAKAAFEKAAQALADQKIKLKTQEFEEDANFLEAEVLLASADYRLLTANFAASHLDSMEALNQIAISDGRFKTLLNEQEGAREVAREATKQSEADRLALEKSAKEEADRLAREAQLSAAEAQAAAMTKELAASATELAVKSAELEALQSALAQTEAEMRAKAENDAVEKAALAWQAAEAKAAAQAAALVAAQAKADRLAREAQLSAAEAQATAKTVELAASAAELAAKSAELEALQSALVQTEAEMRAKAENDIVEKAALERQAAEAKAAAQAAALAAAQAEADRLAREAHLSTAEAQAAANTVELAAIAAELAAKSAELEALQSALVQTEAEVRAKAEKDAVEKAALERQAAEAKPAAQAVALAAAQAEAARLAAEQAESTRLAAEQAEATRYAAELAESARLASERAFASRQAAEQAESTRLAAERATKEAIVLETTAHSAIDQARKAYDKAVARNARNNYPALLAKGAKEIEASRQAFDSGDLLSASAKAESARAILEGISEFAPLPATYKIGMVPERKNMDNLWSIAASPFGYNDPYKWTILYKANKTTLPDPSNPDLLWPGQVIKIPSIGGELREGSWDPKKTYPPRAKR